MKKLLFALIISFFSINSFSQVVINEIDADTFSSDLLEFIELKSNTPTFSLNGYVLVFYNGTSTGLSSVSYFAIDLDGLTTDVNGIIHLGNTQVSPTPAYDFPEATLQNGPDAVALYIGNAIDFPLNTLAHSTGLIDAVAYTSSTTLPTALMTALGETDVPNENLGGTGPSKSIQRKTDGTYEIKAPTPGMNNDGSGIIFNYINCIPTVLEVSEGQSFSLNFSTSQTVATSPLVINFSLNNFGFTTSDFTGNLSVTIPVGSTTGSTTITLLNDGNIEGDEELNISVISPAIPYYLQTNNIIVRVLDANFNVSTYGTPATPTYSLASTQPMGYYNSIENLSGATLKQAIQNIIANPAEVRVHTYSEVYDIITVADQNPANNNQVWLIYTEASRSKLDRQVGSSIVGKWNREHIYPQSRGNYGSGIDYDLPPDGFNNWFTTSADDIGAGLSDAHHIRVADGQENSSRNNKDYGPLDYNGPSGSTANSWKGDVARALFYMAVRYNGLSLVNGNPADSTIGQLGDLATLLAWNQLDPADDFEMNRNNYIYTWQHNRNPFIDYPNLADYIWGANAGQVWNSSLKKNDLDKLQVVMYPNPANDFVDFFGIDGVGVVEIYNTLGEKVLTKEFANETRIQLNLASGVYLTKITSGSKSVTKKLVIQ
ncbi:MAG: endonuclease [Flavobacterium sp.]|uniref:endonuclease n=1 Tax=Flavobacterium sp. TaxID=239 RepID=UPI0022C1AD3C|nr:endonuclease [Flavobacterium sp.]MCZ8196658.1 endonuclease [Flavobacterium sp.]